jgi:formylglycine-generating enzyme required for sulfatase activity
MANKEREKNNFIIEEINLEMIKCPAGSFMMGSPESESGREECEKQLKVIISKSFYIGKYPVTQKQYQAIIGINPSFFMSDYSNRTIGCNDKRINLITNENNPVDSVNWNNAKEFCEILNARFNNIIPHGYMFDLPTEAQWEYACRADTTTALDSGKNIIYVADKCQNLDEVAWYYENSGGQTHEVGQKSPNNWGIYDMLGNIREWCRDWSGNYTEDTIIDPKGANHGSDRVIRGGSWDDFGNICRSAYRGSWPGNWKDKRFGFRLALVPID